ncbi:sterol O-acyltransferase 1-like [Chrysoperla carnea]|uniref:sterol O-acyltransferase 1-like n=1 Tax=Chrysoperla carnea TaxID=189513 RepID=UPI001D08A8B6|nr:sterol O-acyltransferase 1-like [Chrysoperla carnea]
MMEDVEKCGISSEFNSHYKNNDNDSCEDKLRDKNFTPRNSLLTDLFAEKHISTIYNMCVVIIALALIYSALDEYFETGRLTFGVSTIQRLFKGFFPLCGLWICMFVAKLILYYIFNIWAYVHTKLQPNSLQINIWDRLWIILYILYQVAFIVGFAFLARLNHYAICTGFGFFGEQIRLMMKCHAFVRSCIPGVLNYNDLVKHQAGIQHSILPDFSKYLYFLFAPALIYQDNYPRTQEIRWKFLLRNVVESIAVVFVMSHLMERFVVGRFEDYGVVHYDFPKLMFKIIGLSCPTLFIYFCIFYISWQTWQNTFAEGLRFADRLFYKDWWNVTNFGEYFRKVSSMIQDWLYIYIYKDLYEHCGCSKSFSIFSVFIISAVFHEYIIGMAIEIFYPACFFWFTVVGPFAILISKQLERLNKSAGNMFLWFCLSFGGSIVFSLYLIEFYARQNCDYQNDSIYGFIIPRSWICNK